MYTYREIEIDNEKIRYKVYSISQLDYWVLLGRTKYYGDNPLTMVILHIHLYNGFTFTSELDMHPQVLGLSCGLGFCAQYLWNGFRKASQSTVHDVRNLVKPQAWAKLFDE